MLGPSRYAMRHAIADKLAHLAEETVAQARREVFVPEFLPAPGKKPKKWHD